MLNHLCTKTAHYMQHAHQNSTFINIFLFFLKSFQVTGDTFESRAGSATLGYTKRYNPAYAEVRPPGRLQAPGFAQDPSLK